METYRHTDMETYRHTDIQSYRHTDMQTFRHTYQSQGVILHGSSVANYILSGYVARVYNSHASWTNTIIIIIIIITITVSQSGGGRCLARTPGRVKPLKLPADRQPGEELLLTRVLAGIFRAPLTKRGALTGGPNRGPKNSYEQ